MRASAPASRSYCRTRDPGRPGRRRIPAHDQETGEEAPDTKKGNKGLWNALLFVLLLAATIYGVFRGEDIGQLREALAQCRTDWIVCAAGCVLAFLMSSAFSIWLMLRSREMGLGLGRCFLSACVEFFFSAVTPSATGGQPMQIYYLRRKGVPVSVSTVSLLVISIAYKITLILTGLFMGLFLPGLLREGLGKMLFLYWVGIVLFTGWTVFLLLMVFKPRMARSILVWIMSVLEELHIMKNREERQASLEVAMDMYEDMADHIRTHPLLMAAVLAAAAIRRLALLSVTWCVYRALGLSGVSWIRIVLIQMSVAVCSDMLPLPGGMGANEALFLKAFTPVFGGLILPGMVLSRGIGHYCQLILSGVFTMLAMLRLHGGPQGEEE